MADRRWAIRQREMEDDPEEEEVLRRGYYDEEEYRWDATGDRIPRPPSLHREFADYLAERRLQLRSDDGDIIHVGDDDWLAPAAAPAAAAAAAAPPPQVQPAPSLAEEDFFVEPEQLDPPEEQAKEAACVICLEAFNNFGNGQRVACVLSCGHTTCNPCASKNMISQGIYKREITVNIPHSVPISNVRALFVALMYCGKICLSAKRLDLRSETRVEVFKNRTAANSSLFGVWAQSKKVTSALNAAAFVVREQIEKAVNTDSLSKIRNKVHSQWIKARTAEEANRVSSISRAILQHFDSIGTLIEELERDSFKIPCTLPALPVEGEMTHHGLTEGSIEADHEKENRRGCNMEQDAAENFCTDKIQMVSAEEQQSPPLQELELSQERRDMNMVDGEDITEEKKKEDDCEEVIVDQEKEEGIKEVEDEEEEVDQESAVAEDRNVVIYLGDSDEEVEDEEEEEIDVEEFTDEEDDDVIVLDEEEEDEESDWDEEEEEEEEEPELIVLSDDDENDVEAKGDVMVGGLQEDSDESEEDEEEEDGEDMGDEEEEEYIDGELDADIAQDIDEEEDVDVDDRGCYAMLEGEDDGEVVGRGEYGGIRALRKREAEMYEGMTDEEEEDDYEESDDELDVGSAMDLQGNSMRKPCVLISQLERRANQLSTAKAAATKRPVEDAVYDESPCEKLVKLN